MDTSILERKRSSQNGMAKIFGTDWRILCCAPSVECDAWFSKIDRIQRAKKFTVISCAFLFGYGRIASILQTQRAAGRMPVVFRFARDGESKNPLESEFPGLLCRGKSAFFCLLFLTRAILALALRAGFAVRVRSCARSARAKKSRSRANAKASAFKQRRRLRLRDKEADRAFRRSHTAPAPQSTKQRRLSSHRDAVRGAVTLASDRPARPSVAGRSPERPMPIGHRPSARAHPDFRLNIHSDNASMIAAGSRYARR